MNANSHFAFGSFGLYISVHEFIQCKFLNQKVRFRKKHAGQRAG